MKYLLPMVIFKEGFHLQRSSFFKNISHIASFGFFGTICNIVLLGFAIIGFNYLTEHYYGVKTFEFNHCLVLAVVLSNADTLAP